ncbi:hypothetical protein TVAG_191430 [Trichomonas vaginalis G3]|uniref:Abnormal spindle-like microcephaly-associated protein ASH domain-containing protein n=1 Tax=Trichomonas vaginalis (strain ATCC PRA-98 / G3) TaxID=412133 RepID=A2EQJ9_TRIV3|nr:hypothetical protein TVAGG3_0976400 [Trichomonas vaginalis G3]EAY05046.1 hypothetical protein TVAG_191430 [Trichomonas vaginalis G3]KAI5488963.1 hypothetical protein TVAGG3_0976400 [Trichomonas vaginalis G3]|eukprot:XP_001317269.1 hypothetical protein [Trichomonas vaginalis G3]
MSSITNPSIRDLKTSMSISIDKKSIHSFNSSDSPTISIFPKKLLFPQIYPHSIQQKKLLIPNSGVETAEFTLRIADPSPFSVPISTVSIAPGETYALLVSFNPQDVGLFNTSLIFQGYSEFYVPLTGKCVPSPLEIPNSSSKIWTFSKTETERIIELKNKDLSKPLTIVTASDSQAFTVYPIQFEISSASSAKLTITYHPEKESSENPTLTIQCSESGDSFRIPLHIVPPRAKIPVDFGICCVGETITHNLQISASDVSPSNIPPPFSLKSFDPDTNSMIISFSPTNPGKFSAQIELSDVDINLKAAAIERPFSVQISSSFPKGPLFLENTSDADMIAAIKADGYNLSQSNVVLKPGKSVEIHASRNEKEKPSGNIVVSWQTKNGPMSSTINLLDAIEETENQGYLSYEPKILLFNEENTKEQVVVSSSSNFVAKAKKSLVIQNQTKDNFEIVCKKKTETIEQIIIANSTKRLSIPAIISTLPLNLEIPQTVELIGLVENQKEAFKGSFTVTNLSQTSVFVAFSANSVSTIFIDPFTEIIKPNEKKSFNIAADSPGSVNVYYGSEFLRSILAIVNEKNFFSKIAESSLSKSVIKLVSDLPKAKFTKFFKSSLKSSVIKLETKQQKSDSITMSPKVITFDSDNHQETKISNLINMSSSQFEFSVIASSPFILVQPLSGVIKPYSSVNLSVSILKNVNGYISVKCGDFVTKTKVETTNNATEIALSNDSPRQSQSFVDNLSMSLETENMSVNSAKLHFNKCNAGTMRRAMLKVMNKSRSECSITAYCDNPFSLPVSQFVVEPRSFVLLPVHFLPQNQGKYSSKLELVAEDGKKLVVSLSGKCVC